eukprot:CAMPEP_0168359440 /NCGR_PEP_ID=MMETSP0228-20121227/1644_1 /TAXON_ID=133427 /ORGANISM="Protoceratium reticulatum, Strain CCCM 535 (=CCMP 1889)" /LENGTH=126 /DNA_ID=CAMNT_0008372071 /DNA_START=286 /DNA_END=666 /DNA_ORIENTATION=+
MTLAGTVVGRPPKVPGLLACVAIFDPAGVGVLVRIFRLARHCEANVPLRSARLMDAKLEAFCQTARNTFCSRFPGCLGELLQARLGQMPGDPQIRVLQNHAPSQQVIAAVRDENMAHIQLDIPPFL